MVTRPKYDLRQTGQNSSSTKGIIPPPPPRRQPGSYSRALEFTSMVLSSAETNMTPDISTDISTDVFAASFEIYDLPRSSYRAQSTSNTKVATVRGIPLGSGGSSSKNKKDITNNKEEPVGHNCVNRSFSKVSSNDMNAALIINHPKRSPTVKKNFSTDFDFSATSSGSSLTGDLLYKVFGEQSTSTKIATGNKLRGTLRVGSGGSSSKNKKDITQVLVSGTRIQPKPVQPDTAADVETSSEAPGGNANYNTSPPQRIVPPPPPRSRSQRQGQYLQNKCLPKSSDDNGLVLYTPDSHSQFSRGLSLPCRGEDGQDKSPAKNESPRQSFSTRKDSKEQTNQRKDSKQRTPAPQRTCSTSQTWDDSDAELSIQPRQDLVNAVLQVADRVNRQRRPSFDGLKSVLAKGNNSCLVAKGVDIVSSSVRSLSSSRQRPSSVPKNRSKSVPKRSSSASFSNISEPITTLNRTNSNSGRTATLSREILPANGKFDPKTGRCKKHPSVMMAQKSKFRKGCWEMIKAECPLCCEESKRKEHNSGWKDDTILMATLSSSPPKNSCKTHENQTFMNNTLRNSLVHDTTECSNSSPDHHLKDLVATAASDDDTSPVRVSRMPYITSWRESGWYTGEVNSDGRPQGRGRLRTKTGNVVGGMWSNGYSDDNNLERRKVKMQSGFDMKRDGNVGLDESTSLSLCQGSRPMVVSDGFSSRSYRRTGSGSNARSIAPSPTQTPMMGMFSNQGFSQIPPMMYTGQNMEHMMRYYYPQPVMLPMAENLQNLVQNQTTHGQGVVPTMFTPNVNDSK